MRTATTQLLALAVLAALAAPAARPAHALPAPTPGPSPDPAPGWPDLWGVLRAIRDVHVRDVRDTPAGRYGTQHAAHADDDGQPRSSMPLCNQVLSPFDAQVT